MCTIFGTFIERTHFQENFGQFSWKYFNFRGKYKGSSAALLAIVIRVVDKRRYLGIFLLSIGGKRLTQCFVHSLEVYTLRNNYTEFCKNMLTRVENTKIFVPRYSQLLSPPGGREMAILGDFFSKVT